MEHVEHPFAPVADERSRTLILGSMASPVSRQSGFYYAHPQNRFFPALAAAFGEPAPVGTDARRAFLLAHGIALWDVIGSCDITGASDASIRNAVPNDVAGLLARFPITRVFTTGTAATRLYRQLLERQTGVSCRMLPSPSPANCRIPFPELVAAYRAVIPPDSE